MWANDNRGEGKIDFKPRVRGYWSRGDGRPSTYRKRRTLQRCRRAWKHSDSVSNSEGKVRREMRNAPRSKWEMTPMKARWYICHPEAITVRTSEYLQWDCRRKRASLEVQMITAPGPDANHVNEFSLREARMNYLLEYYASRLRSRIP